MALFSAGLSLTYHLSPFVLNGFIRLYFLLWCSQGSVLGHLLFVMYIILLSTLISSHNHHIFADDT